MPQLTVTMCPTASLVPYAGNAKIHTDDQVWQIANSIRDFGFNDPVGIWHDADGKPVIVEGHGRVLAAQLLGMEELPTIALDHLTDEQRRAYVHIHNQTTLVSGFDLEALQAELEALPAFDWGSYGFEAGEVLETLDGVQEDEPLLEAKKPRCKLGDLWALGSHRLLCGDSTDPAQVERLMGGRQADLLLTDPPYNVAYHQNDSDKWDPKLAKQRTDRKVILNDKFDDEASFQRFIEDAMAAGKAAMRPGASWYVWFAAMHGPAVFGAMEEVGLVPKQELCWVKNHFTLGRSDYQWMHEPCLFGWKGGAQHYFAPTRAETTVVDDAQSIKKMSKADMRRLLEELLAPDAATTVLRFDKPLVSAEHPTMKPVKLFAQLIRNSSRRGDAVLDLFGGSGTTAVACEQMGRDAYLMELDPAYCDVIIERWERLTGHEAALIE